MVENRNVIGIVTEFNPFHEGHRYLVNQIRKMWPGCMIIAAMSGDFVQRGEPAVFSKYQRTRNALLQGVDMVIQIPVVGSVASAADFASMGVAVLKATGIVDALVFGSESGDLERLERIAGLERPDSPEKEEYNRIIREALRNGQSYAKARSTAIWTVLKEEGDLLANDILGVAYIRAIHAQGDPFRYQCIVRNPALQSAHRIREELKQKGTTDPTVPCFADLDMLSGMLSYALLQSVYDGTDLTVYMDISREINDAIVRDIRERLSFKERIQRIKSRNYTYTRIARALLHVLLGMKAEDLNEVRAYYSGVGLPYLRVLGVREESRNLLGALRGEVVTSPARYLGKMKKEMPEELVNAESLLRTLDRERALWMFRMDLYAADLYGQIYPMEENEYTQKLIRV